MGELASAIEAINPPQRPEKGTGSGSGAEEETASHIIRQGVGTGGVRYAVRMSGPDQPPSPSPPPGEGDPPPEREPRPLGPNDPTPPGGTPIPTP